MQCFRTDLKVNDIVLVRRTDGQLRFATVLKLEYLNWDCKGFILCKNQNVLLMIMVIYALRLTQLLYLELRLLKFSQKLIDSGWILLRPHSATYRKILTKLMDHRLHIFLLEKWN